MEKALLLDETKSMELKLHALKVQGKAEKPKIEIHASASLYGILKGRADITVEDIDAVKIKSNGFVAR
ncbi:MAG: hypothetical protein AABY76_09955 [Planctomycetota bacterium]|jgi:hypothetical protein